MSDRMTSLQWLGMWAIISSIVASMAACNVLTRARGPDEVCAWQREPTPFCIELAKRGKS